MPQVTVTIAGRVYRMACGEGEEAHLQGLAERVDGKITALRRDFGEIGDQRITVMAAITMADDLSEAERRIAALQAEVSSANEARRRAEEALDELGQQVAAAVDDATARVDRLAHGMLAGLRS